MTTFFQGMSAQEIANFTEEMMLSGEGIEMMDVSALKSRNTQLVASG